jgi:hypothetical protein
MEQKGETVMNLSRFASAAAVLAMLAATGASAQTLEAIETRRCS